NKPAVFDALKGIAEDAAADTSPEVLAKSAQFFIEHKQYEKAVQLYITGKLYHKAIDLCQEQRVKINEDMAERLTPPKVPKDSPGEREAREERNEVL
ncbi:unnamed protein product, partial [Chrysoparadoxa australica]